MIDLQVQRLLRHAIDTPTKLHLLLIFYEHPSTRATPKEMAQRTCRDIWSITQSLAEMAEDGMLQVIQEVPEPMYIYQPRPEYLEAVGNLMLRYDNPMERNKVHRSIRDLSVSAPLRRTSGQRSSSSQ